MPSDLPHSLFFPIFDEALELPSEERAAYLDSACAGNDDLRAHVERLLEGDHATGLLDASPEAWSHFLGGSTIADDFAGSVVGSFRLVREIGRGGMGVVYLAERISGGFDQTVAVKLVQSRAAGSEARERFEAERRMLARLEHPAIARVVDGGVTDGGVPYLAMEYVDGVPLTEFCANEALGTRARVDLFKRVGEAVQVAHRNFIVHRDLKPSNVLVTAAGDPKLLDFGIAKSLDGPSDVLATSTILAFSPAYAAPEQIRGELPTTATDVYGLCAILYELLAGSPPFGTDGETPLDVQLAILNRDADPPSKRASNPQTVPSELDAIVLKGLRKEPESRYPTVADLIRDLDAWIHDEPVAATEGNTAYRVRKAVKRHRLSIATASIVLVSLVTALGVSLTKTREATRARETALGAQAETSAINDFLLNDLLGAAAPERARGDDLTVREILDDASMRVDGRFPDEPAVEASVHRVLARTYERLGEYESALPHGVRALELYKSADPSSAATTRAAQRLVSELHMKRGDYERAESVLDSVVATQGIATELDRLETSILRGDLLHATGADDSAAVVLEAAAERLSTAYPDEWRLQLAARQGHARALLGQRLWREAESVCREALAIEIAHLGADHPDVVRTRSTLVSILTEDARYEEAIPAGWETVAAAKSAFGEAHPAVAAALHRLMLAYAREGDLRRADSLSVVVSDLLSEVLGPTHPRTLTARHNYAIGLARDGDVARALVIYREVLADSKRGQGATHPSTRRFQYVLANALMDAGEEAEARDVTIDLYAAYESMIADSTIDFRALVMYADDLLVTGPESIHNPTRAMEVAAWATELSEGKRYESHLAEAEAAERLGLDEHAIESLKRALGVPEGARSFTSERLLATMLIDRGRFDEAESALTDLLRIRRDTRDPDDWLIGNSLTWLGRVNLAAGRLPKSEAYLREAVKQLTAGRGPTYGHTASARLELGRCLDEQARTQDAEAELLAAFEIFDGNERTRRETWEDARDAIAAHYTERGMTKLAATWRARSIE